MIPSLEKKKVIVVDFDGTLIKTDSLLEAILAFIKTNPLDVLSLIFHLFKGIISFKRYVAKSVCYDKFSKSFPLNQDLIEYLRSEKTQGAKLVLVTATLDEVVRSIIEHLGLGTLFDEIYGTKNSNLKGPRKLEFILNKFKGNFEEIAYCGNDSSDLYIWYNPNVNEAIITGRKCGILKSKITSKRKSFIKIKTIDFPKVTFIDWLKAIRIHQWAKNCLTFVPVLCSFNFLVLSDDIKSFIAFLAFSFAASSTYIINDLLDLPNDRRHETKCKRAFASSKIGIPSGLVFSFILLVLSFLVCLFLPKSFLLVLLFYIFLTLLYSFFLKKVVLLDLIVLSILYLTRIFAGNTATSIEPSYWLFTFAFMVFLSLGALKRFIELFKKYRKMDLPTSSLLNPSASLTLGGRGYFLSDLLIVLPLGVSSYIASIVFFSIYITSAETVKNYSSPELLWIVQLIFVFLLGNLWFYALRGKIDYDPVLYFIKDRKCLICLLLVAFIAIFAYYF